MATTPLPTTDSTQPATNPQSPTNQATTNPYNQYIELAKFAAQHPEQVQQFPQYQSALQQANATLQGHLSEANFDVSFYSGKINQLRDIKNPTPAQQAELEKNVALLNAARSDLLNVTQARGQIAASMQKTNVRPEGADTHPEVVKSTTNQIGTITDSSGQVRDIIVNQGGTKYTVSTSTGALDAIQNAETYVDYSSGKAYSARTGAVLDLSTPSGVSAVQVLGLKNVLPAAPQTGAQQTAENAANAINAEFGGSRVAVVTPMSGGYILEANHNIQVSSAFGDVLKNDVTGYAKLTGSSVMDLGQGRYFVKDLTPPINASSSYSDVFGLNNPADAISAFNASAKYGLDKNAAVSLGPTIASAEAKGFTPTGFFQNKSGSVTVRFQPAPAIKSVEDVFGLRLAASDTSPKAKALVSPSPPDVFPEVKILSGEARGEANRLAGSLLQYGKPETLTGQALYNIGSAFQQAENFVSELQTNPAFSVGAERIVSGVLLLGQGGGFFIAPYHSGFVRNVAQTSTVGVGRTASAGLGVYETAEAPVTLQLGGLSFLEAKATGRTDTSREAAAFGSAAAFEIGGVTSLPRTAVNLVALGYNAPAYILGGGISGSVSELVKEIQPTQQEVASQSGRLGPNGITYPAGVSNPEVHHLTPQEYAQQFEIGGISSVAFSGVRDTAYKILNVAPGGPILQESIKRIAGSAIAGGSSGAVFSVSQDIAQNQNPSAERAVESAKVGAAFAAGFQAVQIAAELNPIKYGEVRVVVPSANPEDTTMVGKGTTEKVIYRGLYFSGGEGEAYPLVGKSETGVLIGYPKNIEGIEKNFPSLKQTVYPEQTVANRNVQSYPQTSLETSVRASSGALEVQGVSENDIRKVELTKSFLNELHNQESVFLRNFPEQTKTLTPEETKAVLEHARQFPGEYEKIYGSFSQGSQVAPEFQRVPGDIEIQLKAGSEAEALKIAQGYANVLKTFEPDVKMEGITVLVRGEKALDLHFAGDSEAPVSYISGQQGIDQAFGFERNRPTIQNQGVTQASLNEQLIRKGEGATKFFTTAEGQTIVEPGIVRGKDVPDFYRVVTSLTESGERIGTLNPEQARNLYGQVFEYRNLVFSTPGVSEGYAALDETLAASANKIDITGALQLQAAQEATLASQGAISGAVVQTSTSLLSPRVSAFPSAIPSPGFAVSSQGANSDFTSISPTASPKLLSLSPAVSPPGSAISVGGRQVPSSSPSGSLRPLTSPGIPISVSTSPSRSSPGSGSLSNALSGSPGESPSLSPSESPSSSPSESPGLSESPSLSPSSPSSPSLSPSLPPSESPSISPSESPSLSLSSPPSTSPSISLSPPSPPPTKPPGIPPTGNLLGVREEKRKVPLLSLRSRQKQGSRSFYSDILSVDASLVRYGKATSPSVITRGYLERPGSDKIPTVEMLKERKPAPGLLQRSQGSRLALNSKSSLSFGGGSKLSLGGKTKLLKSLTGKGKRGLL